MPISDVDARIRVLGSSARSLEKLSIGTSEAYTDRIIPPYTTLSLVASDGAVVKVCRELIFDGQLGQDEGYPHLVAPTDVWTSDTEDVDLAGRWDVSNIATTEPVLDKTAAVIPVSHAMEVSLVDQDDVFGIPFSNGLRRRGYGSNLAFARANDLAAGAPYVVRINHLDDDVLELLQYQVRELRHADTNPTKYWDGSAWQTTAQWVDVSGSATLATFVDDVTLDEGSFEDNGPAYYELWIRPKTDYVAGLSTISNVGVCEKVAAADFDLRLNANEERIITTGPFWSRVGAIADNATKTLWVSELGGHK